MNMWFFVGGLLLGWFSPAIGRFVYSVVEALFETTCEVFKMIMQKEKFFRCVYYDGGVMIDGDGLDCNRLHSCDQTIRAIDFSHSNFEIYIRSKDKELARYKVRNYIREYFKHYDDKYPYIHQRCVNDEYGVNYPTYDIDTGEILLDEKSHLVEGVVAKTRNVISNNAI